MLSERTLSPRMQAGPPSAARILLADQQGLFASGLKAMLQLYAGAQVQIHGLEERQILPELRKGSYDILLLHLQFNVPGTADLLRQIYKLRPGLRLLVVTDISDNNLLHALRRFRISGMMSGSADTQQLVQAIDQLMAGQSYLCPLAQYRFDNPDAAPGRQILTPREREILCLIGREYTSEEISQTLFISKGTVDTHRKNLIAKLRVRNAVGLALYALRNRLVG